MHLVLPQIDHDELIDTLVNERQNGIHAQYFEGIREQWKIRTRFYIARGGNPELIEPWNLVGEYGGTLRNLYSSRVPDAVQTSIIRNLRDRKLQLCPFCGESGAPRTLDHYLPQQDFPELAVIPANLAPMCDACQDEKGTKIADENNRRYFLHPYFDEVTKCQLITLTVHEPYDAPTGFDLRPILVLEDGWRSLVERHLRELDVKGRFTNYFDEQYVRLLRQVQEIRAGNQNVRWIVEQFVSINRKRSRNCWDHVFYAGVLANAELMMFLEVGDLPQNL
ncbi:hypothetical protein ACSFA8_06525 [Variovorax sp. RT4R15]|uniref:hypothetical protein n=1 Tax=Variovorax sp. RT4R15 TaxID=3443737 RepID=UPI003F45003C